MKTREAMVAEGTAAYGDGETVPGTAADENDETPPPAPSGEGERRRMFMETPPTDDVCPICFGDFQVPCRAPCGHWYCGSCILQYWNFGAELQPCKCPMCLKPITKLNPEASVYHSREAEIRKVLQNVGSYNRLFVGGISGFMLQKVLRAIPLYLKREFHRMLNGGRPPAVINDLGIVSMLVASVYPLIPFDFLIGEENVTPMFDHFAIPLSLILPMVGLHLRRRWQRNVRELANMQHEHQD